MKKFSETFRKTPLKQTRNKGIQDTILKGIRERIVEKTHEAEILWEILEGIPKVILEKIPTASPTK